jgi:hypothetical protein
MKTLAAALVLVVLLGASGCGSAPKQAPGQPPTPGSITSDNPGGDASDPERAALERLLKEPWGHRRDRWGTLRVPLADAKNWRRVRIWGHPTRATFRYGDDHHAIVTIWYTPIEGANDPDACMAKFLDYARPIGDSYGVHLGDAQVVRMNQAVGSDVRPIVVQLLDGSMEGITGTEEYVGAIAAYQSWPGTCLVQGFAAAAKHRSVAIKVRDRWVAEAAAELEWESKVKDAPPTTAR